MMNPEFFLTMVTLPETLQQKATKISDNLMQIISAAAQGEL